MVPDRSGVVTDDVLEAVADERRRWVASYFATRPEDVTTVRELAAYVADRCTAAGDREREAVRLHHCDLPKLEAVGLLEFDPRNGTVRGRTSPAIVELLDGIRAAVGPSAGVLGCVDAVDG